MRITFARVDGFPGKPYFRLPLGDRTPRPSPGSPFGRSMQDRHTVVPGRIVFRRGRREEMRKKAERRWTLMVVPHGSGSSRAVEVSQTFVKALVGIGSVVALTFLVLGVAAISRGVNITHSRALENENRLLADEIQRMRERMTGLRDTLHRFSEREQELRLLAGLTPTDTMVQQAGIGGAARAPAAGGRPTGAGPPGRAGAPR